MNDQEKIDLCKKVMTEIEEVLKKYSVNDIILANDDDKSMGYMQMAKILKAEEMKDGLD